jgi:hypothetical protein
MLSFVFKAFCQAKTYRLLAVAAITVATCSPSFAQTVTQPAAQPGPSPTLAQIKPGPRSILTSPQNVRDAREQLYNLNYRVELQGSTLDENLQTAIRRWQTVTKQPLTGDLTAADLERLRRAQKATIWGAIAYSWTGATGAVWSHPTRASAETEAKRLCEVNSGRACSVTTMSGTNCAAASHATGGEGERHRAWALFDKTLDDARGAALDACQKGAGPNGKCVIRSMACADGSHKKQ